MANTWSNTLLHITLAQKRVSQLNRLVGNSAFMAGVHHSRVAIPCRRLRLTVSGEPRNIR